MKDVVEKPGFDLTTHVFDTKTGELLKHQPYRLIIDRAKGSFYERGGKLYNLDGTPAQAQTEAPKVEAAPTQGNTHNAKRVTQ